MISRFTICLIVCGLMPTMAMAEVERVSVEVVQGAVRTTSKRPNNINIELPELIKLGLTGSPEIRILHEGQIKSPDFRLTTQVTSVRDNLTLSGVLEKTDTPEFKARILATGSSQNVLLVVSQYANYLRNAVQNTRVEVNKPRVLLGCFSTADRKQTPVHYDVQIYLKYRLQPALEREAEDIDWVTVRDDLCASPTLTREYAEKLSIGAALSGDFTLVDDVVVYYPEFTVLDAGNSVVAAPVRSRAGGGESVSLLAKEIATFVTGLLTLDGGWQLESETGSAFAAFEQAQASCAKELYSRCVAQAREAVSLQRGFSEAQLLLGRALFEIGSYDKALNELSAIKEVSAERQEYLARTLAGLGRYNDAVDSLDALDEFDIRLRELKGDLYSLLNDTDAAITSYQMALASPDSTVSAASKLANAYREAGLQDDAIEVLKQAVEQHPDATSVKRDLILILRSRISTDVYAKQPNFDRAISDHLRIVEIGRDESPRLQSMVETAYPELAELLLITGECAQAGETAREFLSKRRRSARFLLLSSFFLSVAELCQGEVSRDTATQFRTQLRSFSGSVDWDFLIFDEWLERSDLADKDKDDVRKLQNSMT